MADLPRALGPSAVLPLRRQVQGDVLRRRQLAVVLQARAIFHALETGDEQQQVQVHVACRRRRDDDDGGADDDARKKNLRVKV